MSGRTAFRLAGPAAALALALSACTGDGSPTAQDPAPSPTATGSPGSTETADEPRRPKPGECHRMSLEVATRPTHQAEPVPCKDNHTAMTVHVGPVAELVKGDAPAVDSPKVQRGLARTCPERLADFLGGDAERRALSRFQAVWFSPTLEEAAAGADWYRCDVVALAREDKLMRLPTDRRLKGVLDRPAALREFGLCGTARPGSDGFDRVACALDHSWVAVATIPIEGGNRYPGREKVRAAGEGACAEEAEGTGTALELEYGWEWPTKSQWEAGQRYGYCWVPA